MVHKFFVKKSQGSGISNNEENIQLADELDKPIIGKFNKRKCIHHLETISGALI